MSTSGTKNEKGTGLGLLLCKEYLHKTGGKLTVESTPGKGSTFTIQLPVGR
jgi:signal transduction histidine kinase